MSELGRSVVVAGIVVALTAAITATLRHQERLQHLAVPTLRAREAAPAPATTRLEPLEARGSEVVLKLDGRISALERDAAGTLWIGLFDRGLARWRPGAEDVDWVRTRPGRERFVSDLLVDGEPVFAATFAGVLEVAQDGERVRLHLEGVGVEALTRVGERVFAGTAKGLYVRGPSGDFVPVDSGAERPRVTAMVGVEDRLWLATSRGVYVLAFDGPRAQPTWIPLVFGEPGARTNVATAIAPDGRGGVVVGTDDGGLVRIDREGRVAAAAFEDPRANEINPGAATRIGAAVAVGTQGGGVLIASPGATTAQYARGAAVSAVATDGEALLVGTAEGVVLRVVLDRGGDAAVTAARL